MSWRSLPLSAGFLRAGPQGQPVAWIASRLPICFAARMDRCDRWSVPGSGCDLPRDERGSL